MSLLSFEDTLGIDSVETKTIGIIFLKELTQNLWPESQPGWKIPAARLQSVEGGQGKASSHQRVPLNYYTS